MDTTFSASTSEKTQTGSTPFDAIAALEKQETMRVEDEKTGMEQEKAEVRESVQKKEQMGEQELRDTARNELRQYKESDLAPIIKQGELAGNAETEKLDQSYASQEEGVVQKLTEMVIDPNSPLFSDS